MAEPRHRGALRRRQVLRVALRMFGQRGLHGTTTRALAKAAGVTEPTVYLYFDSKVALFREALRVNQESRLRTLARRPASTPLQLAEATVLACLTGAGHAALTNWALLELPEEARPLYGKEREAVAAHWSSSLGRPVPDVWVDGAMAYGLWLAAQGLTVESATPGAARFAGELVRVAA